MISTEELLAHKSFRKLEQHASHWELTHLSHDGSATVSLCDKWLDRLLRTFAAVIEAIEAEEEPGHVCEFRRAWQDGTLVCACGAWR